MSAAVTDPSARALLALGLEVVFFAVAFGWRSFVQWRRTGSTGFVGFPRRASGAEKAGAVAFVAALVLLVAAPLAALAGLSGFVVFESAVFGVAGTALGLLGIAATVAAQLAMGTSWRIGVDPGERTELVTDGVFARVRNPIFSAMILAAVGLALLVPNVVSVTAVVVLVAGVTLQVTRVEEPYLRRVHGSRFGDYQRRTGRFVPRLTRRGTR